MNLDQQRKEMQRKSAMNSLKEVNRQQGVLKNSKETIPVILQVACPRNKHMQGDICISSDLYGKLLDFLSTELQK